MGETLSSEFCCPASSVEGMGWTLSAVSADSEVGETGSVSVHEAKHIIIEAAAKSRTVNLNPLMRIYLLEGVPDESNNSDCQHYYYIISEI